MVAAEFFSRGAEWRGAIANAASCPRSVLKRGHQILCGVMGHSLMLAFRRDRLLLQCADCGYQSPGWEIGARPLRPVAPRASRLATRSRHAVA